MLSEIKINEIKRLLESGMSNRWVASRANVSRASVDSISSGTYHVWPKAKKTHYYRDTNYGDVRARALAALVLSGRQKASP